MPQLGIQHACSPAILITATSQQLLNIGCGMIGQQRKVNPPRTTCHLFLYQV